MRTRFEIAFNVDRISLYDTVRLVDSRRPDREVAGTVVFIFRANVPRSREDVCRFFGVTEDNRWFERLCRATTRDWIVVLKTGKDSTYVFPRTVAYSRFLTELEVIKPTIHERCALRKQWQRR